MMPTSSPFERADLPRAERTIAAEVAEVYGALRAIDRWSLWLDEAAAPIRAVGQEAFELSWVRDGSMRTRRISVLAAGPVHALTLAVDQELLVHVRTRPHPQGTSVSVVLEALEPARRRERVFARRRTEQASARLRALLDELAAHIESGGAAPAAP